MTVRALPFQLLLGGNVAVEAALDHEAGEVTLVVLHEPAGRPVLRIQGDRGEVRALAEGLLQCLALLDISELGEPVHWIARPASPYIPIPGLDD